jgi:predicted PurR-regulated permease PerM
MKFEWNKRYTTISIYAIIVFVICAIIYRFITRWNESTKLFITILNALSPFVIAFLIAYFINPMVVFWETKIIPLFKIKGKSITSHKTKRGLSIFLSYLLVLGFTILLLAFIIPQLIKSISEIGPNITEYLKKLMGSSSESHISIFGAEFTINFKVLNDYLSEHLPQTVTQLSGLLEGLVPEIFTFTKNVASWFFNIVLALIIAIYILMSKETSLNNAKKMIFALFSPKFALSLINISKESHRIFSKFFIGKLIDSLIIGILCFIILLFAKIDYALLLSVFVGITNIIPYFGPFFGGILGFLLLLITTPIKALWFALIVLALQQFDGNILGPKILGDSTGLSPFWVIFSIILFGKLFGIIGMFLGIPCFAVIKNIIDRQIDIRYRKRISSIDS